MFSGSNVLVTGGNLTNSTYQMSGVSRGFDILKSTVAAGAFHNSADRFDPPKCHPKTREAVIHRIIAWARGLIDTDAFILWLYGPAGAGKSAIAQSIAEIFEELGLLLSSFFFSRTSPDRQRSSIKSVVANIAYRMTVAIPASKSRIESAIEADPLIFECSLDVQLSKLVVHPLQELIETCILSQPKYPFLVVIDGLDECIDTAAQECLISLLASTASLSNFPVKFLIASRPELQIKIAFASIMPQSIISHLELNDDYLSQQDIRLFLEDKFQEIKERHPWRATIPHTWPTEETIDSLVRKASGQFIYASVVFRFTNSLHHQPTNRLDIILGLRPPVEDLPFAEIDELYRQILSTSVDVALVLRILGVAIACERAPSPYPPELVCVSAVLDFDIVDIKIALVDLSPLLEWDEYDALIFHHASFADFLLTEQRSKDYHINIVQVHTDIVQWFLQAFRDSQHLDHVLQDLYPTMHYHLAHAVITSGLERELQEFPITDYLRRFLARAAPLRGPLLKAIEALNAFKQVRNSSGQQSQLYNHHFARFEEFILARIKDSPHPSLFPVLRMVGLALWSEKHSDYDPDTTFRQNPIGSVEVMVEVADEPLARKGKYQPIWLRLCGTIFRLNPSDLEWDRDNFRLLNHYSLASFVEVVAYVATDKAAKGYDAHFHGGNSILQYPVTARVLSGGVKACLEYLRRRGSRGTHPSLHFLRAWSRKSTKKPWLWRQRMKRGLRVCSCINKWKHKNWKPLRLSPSLERLPQIFDSRYLPEVSQYTEQFAMYAFALELTVSILAITPASEDIVEELSQPFILHPATVALPRRTRCLKKAIRKYLKQAHNSNDSSQDQVAVLGAHTK